MVPRIPKKKGEKKVVQEEQSKSRRLVGWRWKQPHGMFGILAVLEDGLEQDFLVERLADSVYRVTALEMGRSTSFLTKPKEWCSCGQVELRSSVQCLHQEMLLAKGHEL